MLTFCQNLVCSYEHVISIDSSEGHDNPMCLQSNSGVPCHTLEYVESMVKSVTNTSVLIDVCQPGINLSRALYFTDFEELSIQGEKGADYVGILCNQSNSGLTFVNISNFSLNRIQLSECGVSQNKTSHFEICALYLIYCHNVNITQTVVSRSNGTGISFVDTDGIVIIQSTTIMESSLHFEGDHCSKSICEGGRGLTIVFDPSTASDSSVDFLPVQRRYNNTTYTIDNLKCVRNRAKTTENQSDLCGSTGIGGGALVILGNNATNINMTITDSLFQDNNAYCGGGLQLTFYSYNKNNHVSLIQTNFSRNTVKNGSLGGGFQIFIFSHSPDYDKVNTLKLFSCTFANNSEGGITIWSDDMGAQDGMKIIFFTNCSWTGNIATKYGAAVQIMAGISATETRGRYPAIVFINSTFTSNKIKPILRKNVLMQTNTASTFYTNVLSVVFEGRTVFEGNDGTALYLSCSIASFRASSNIKFLSNSGTNGGAVALIGRSYLYLNGSSNFTFLNNTATHHGGAIYFQSVDTVVYQPCFIVNKMCKTESLFYFNGNKAGGQGQHIFGTSFAGCSISYCTVSCNKSKPTDLFRCLGNFKFDNPENKTTSTLPTSFSLNTSLVTLFPGLPEQLDLTVIDMEGNSVPSVSYQANLARKSSFMHVDRHFQYVSNNTIGIDGKPGENDTLELNALPTDISLFVNVSLLECPPGYILDNSTMTCNCSASDYYGLLRCDPNVYIRYGVWMGECNSTHIMCTADCPIGYCTFNATYTRPKLQQKLPMSASRLEAAICSPTRKGTICGSCKEGHSVYYNSWKYECHKNKQCHLGAVYFTLSTIIPLTILFVVITLLDTNFANHWNGFLLFAQMVRVISLYGNGTIRYTQLQFKILDWTMFAFNIFSLEFFSTEYAAYCIWKGANFMDIQMIKLGSVMFALVLVFLCVCLFNQRKIMRLFPCLLRRRYTVMNGICAFFILCYSQCCHACFRVLNFKCLLDSNNNCVKRVLLFSGDMEAFHNPHLKYAIVAVTFLVFIITLPTLLLLVYPLVFKLLGYCRLSESTIVVFIWKIIPIQILDSFQNPFKDEYRFFAGLYLLYRALIMAMTVFVGNLIKYYAVVQLILVTSTVLHAVFQPYRSRMCNIVDLLLFFNLVFINGIAQYTYTVFINTTDRLSHTDKVEFYFWTVLEIILLLIPLFCVMIYLAKTFLDKVKAWKAVKKGYAVVFQNYVS